MIVLPTWVSKMLNKKRASKGDMPIGVVYVPRIKKYMSKCRAYNKQKTLGYFESKEMAFFAYKQYKESYVKESASAQRNELPPEVYELMMNWEVNIDD